MQRLLIYIIGLVFCTVNFVFAQDAVYSQFYNSNTVLNPALTGVFNGQQRLTLQYRDQWSSIHRSESYKTYSAQFESKVHIKGNDFLTYGLDFSRDQAGSSSYLQQSGHLNVAYIKQLGANSYSNVDHFLVGGLKLGAGQNRVDVSNLWFGNQFDKSGGAINWGSNSNEDLINDGGRSPLFGDFGFGLLYYNVMGERKNFYAGVSASHINQPDISLTEFGSIRLKRLITLHTGVELPQNRELSHMINAVMHIQNPSFMLVPGYVARYKHKDWKEIALRAGIWTRILAVEGLANDALIFGATFEYESLQFGISYDVSTSSIVRANSGRGALEFSFQYINRNTKYRAPIKCPRF